jgi:hypothetical protein
MHSSHLPDVIWAQKSQEMKLEMAVAAEGDP